MTDRAVEAQRGRFLQGGRFLHGPGIGTDSAGAAWSGIGRITLALVMIGLGVRGLWLGEFASVWQAVPKDLLGSTAWARAAAAVELAAGLALLWRPSASAASWVLLAFTALWAALLQLPPVIAAPDVAGTWLGLGEITVIVAAAWLLCATRGSPIGPPASKAGVIAARVLFALSLPAIGVSHFVYVAETVSFVPEWLPYPVFWAYLTGAGNIAASVGILFGLVPRLAAALEAAMLAIITLLVWLPGALAAPGDASLTPLLISAAIASGAWVAADSYRGLPWLPARE